MRVKLTTSLANPDEARHAGEEHEYEQAEAIRLIEAGFAVPVAAKAAEKATKSQAPEQRANKSEG
jgi:hypothetical protein